MLDRSTIDVSFIIPAFNEEDHIGGTVRAIHEAMRGGRSYEIIVVDHGSTDRTRTVAADGGARVVRAADAATIAELRNRAAQEACGQVFAFIDADVRLDSTWGAAFTDLWRELQQEPRTIAGASLEVPSNSGWLATTWFRHARADGEVSQVGSGHMILPRDLFALLGGFPTFETGEDHALCVAARAQGARIVTRRRLIAFHLGAPRTLKAFWRRELWHGRGDTQTIPALLRSPVMWAAAGFVLLHAVILLGLAVHLDAATPFGAAVAIVFLVGASSARRTRSRRTVVWIRGALLFYLYYWARALAAGRALVGVLIGRKPSNGRRTRAAG